MKRIVVGTVILRFGIPFVQLLHWVWRDIIHPDQGDQPLTLSKSPISSPEARTRILSESVT